MNKMEIIKRPETLPDTITKIKNYMVLKRKQAQAFKKKLEAIRQMDLPPEQAKILKEQALIDAQEAAIDSLSAEIELGRRFKQIPKARGIRTDLDKNQLTTIKRSKLKDLGFNEPRAYEAERMNTYENEIADMADEKIRKKEIPERKDAIGLMKKLGIEEEKIKRPRPIKPILYAEDAFEFLDGIENKSVDLLLTDPPYMTEFKSKEEFKKFTNGWVPIAVSKVKDTGRIYIFTGNYPEELHTYLSILLNQNDFVLSNILIWGYFNTIGPSPKMGYKQSWNAVFYLYGKGASELNPSEKRERNLIEKFDTQIISAPDGRHEIRYSTFQKPEEIARRFIWHSTNEGDLIIDPFVGTGTFLLVAGELGREARGAEIDKEMLKICRKRGLFIYES